jgi:hypothetical protein
MVTDKHGRDSFKKPQAKKLNIFNRPFKYMSTTAETHANDLYSLISSYPDNQRPSSLGLICDNGPDFNPASWLVFYHMGSLWKDLKLDQLIICSYAPNCSKFNPIEIAWGNISQMLAQITLCSDHKKYNFNLEDNIKSCCIQALNELKNIIDKGTYANSPIRCENCYPNHKEYPYNEYETIKDIIKDGPSHPQHRNERKNIVFLLNHCIKRKYYLHFKKCNDSGCKHCKDNPIKNRESFKFLSQFNDQLPIPIFQDGIYEDHYPTLLNLQKDAELKGKYDHISKNSLKEDRKENRICRTCDWYFESKADENKHKRYCP